MANTKSSKKRARRSEKCRQINLTRKTAIKTLVKKLLLTVEDGNDVAAAQNLLRETSSKIARARGKGLFHRNTASRKISGLAKRVAAMGRTAQ